MFLSSLSHHRAAPGCFRTLAGLTYDVSHSRALIYDKLHYSNLMRRNYSKQQ